MTLTIEHKESIDGWESLLREFFSSIGITKEEKIIKTLDGLQKNLDKKKQYAVCAYSDGVPCGFIFAKDANVTLEMTSFYIQPDSVKISGNPVAMFILSPCQFQHAFNCFFNGGHGSNSHMPKNIYIFLCTFQTVCGIFNNFGNSFFAFFT